MVGKADIRNPLSLLAHERSRFATCQWELLTPTDISIPLTHRLVLYALEAGECLFCVQSKIPYDTAGFYKKIRTGFCISSFPERFYIFFKSCYFLR